MLCRVPEVSGLFDERLVCPGLVGVADGGDNVGHVGRVGRRQQCRVDHRIVTVVLQSINHLNLHV